MKLEEKAYELTLTADHTSLRKLAEYWASFSRGSKKTFIIDSTYGNGIIGRAQLRPILKQMEILKLGQLAGASKPHPERWYWASVDVGTFGRSLVFWLNRPKVVEPIKPIILRAAPQIVATKMFTIQLAVGQAQVILPTGFSQSDFNKLAEYFMDTKIEAVG